ncbi:hypothetical protein BDQ17DRAFT_1331275 [Cyathus striatus]|nr:hypothetical protein BDQ17DRAFT_1331275 [Cyathus striatus]
MEEFYLSIVKLAFFPYELTFKNMSEIYRTFNYIIRKRSLMQNCFPNVDGEAIIHIREDSDTIRRQALTCIRNIHVHVINKCFDSKNVKGKYVLNENYLSESEKEDIDPNSEHILEFGPGKDVENVIEPTNNKDLQIHIVVDLAMTMEDIHPGCIIMMRKFKNYFNPTPITFTSHQLDTILLIEQV